MRYTHKFFAINKTLQSPIFIDREKAIAWGADTAAASGYHSKILCTTTTLPDDENDNRILDVQTIEIGAVLKGKREMLDRLDGVGYPTW